MMKVKVFPSRKGMNNGNIIWKPAYPMRNGKFPPNHPVAPGAKFGLDQIGNGKMDEFRARGYWASCFPEGDGITWNPLNGQPFDVTLQDIREVFGWEVDPQEAK